VQGIDYEETFAPVAKFVTVRVMLSLAAHFDWEIHQMDVKTAFLYPYLNEEVYMGLPEGYLEYYPSAAESNQSRSPVMLLLQKCLYGLKQSPRAWHHEIDSFMLEQRLSPSNEDPNLYISSDILIILYVDNIVLFASNPARVIKVKEALSKRYKMSDLGEIRQCLGLQIERDPERRTLFLHQRR
jgi:hypothetical protein